MDQPAITYSSYLRVPELLDLQPSTAPGAAHDELLFVVLHQSHELWFRLVLHELDDIARHVARDAFPAAEARLRRVVTVMRQLVAQWDVLGTMTPQGYLAFRDTLAGGSGFQSVQWREIEFTLGLPDEGYLRSPWLSEAERDRLTARLQAPTLRDLVEDARVRAGGTDWVEVLREADRWPLLAQLAETLLDADEAIGHWRHRHVLAVERQIGLKPGTGGSTGAAYLRSTLTKRFFPDLWEARTRL